MTYFEKGEFLPEEDMIACKCVLHKVKQETVGQFINIIQGSDEFYEGDICKNKGDEILVIKWGTAKFLAWYPETDDFKSIIKVFSSDVGKLGNIWDNPSLLP